jgi:hypothetical protein
LSTTFDHVRTSDPKWTERVVVYTSTTSGNVNFMTGLARYANRNIMDAYAMVTLENKTAHVVRRLASCGRKLSVSESLLTPTSH